ncbi:transcription termination factor MTERF9, chloroplastic isoform X2 [Cornus florida]|uniref:transcription termination factor MTERF9, chloroplastic isoform X2 n=1 Tax=Cornus florida TaxID=4283 RepID=UPI0028977625|nr:transcription termination factor MTERF9, chloroplastic isoform X2 [Cornus florida]
MAVFSLYPLNPIRSSHSSSSSFYGHPSYFNGGDPLSNSNNNSVRGRVDKPRRGNSSRVFVLSSHSNPKTIKSNRRSRYGQTLSPYDSDDEEEDNDDDSDDDWLSNDGSAELEESDAGSHKHLVKNGTNTLEKRNLRNFYHTSKKRQNTAYLGADGRKKLEAGRSTNNRFRRLSEELDLDEKWFPLLDYLSTFGLKESHFIQMYERHMPSLQINVGSAQERLEYLLSVGVKHKDIKKVLLRQPQILGYTVERNLKSHVAFLLSLGIQGSRIGQIITATPSLFSYSVENSLKPTVRYLLEEVGIDKDDLSKVVQLSPQILVQRIDNTWNTRFNFLTKELGAPRDSIVKMVRKHPQLLHYSIEDGLLPRINFLRSIGMRNSEILKVLTSLTQVFSLSLEGNLKPKYMYLINELRNEVQSLTKYPTYLSLSLDQRIRPRHRFLVSLKKAPKGPFPLSSFVPTDECFCRQWAETSLEKYLAFRQTLLLKEFAQKYERK